jgi:GNAT superfamily N-acetyltransferase
METKIRTALLTDADVIADFNIRLALETEQRQLDSQRVQAGVVALLSDPAKGAYYVAEVQSAGTSTVAGQLLITYEWSDWRNGNFWWIQSVYVAQDFRGRGLFRALYHHAQSLAKAARDVCGFRLYVERHNAVAQEAYARLGMKKTDYEMFELDSVLRP